MSRIKRNNRRLQRGPPTGDSPKTFRLVVISTLGFFFLCVLVACICFADDLKPKATTVSKHDSSMIFKNPSELQSDLIKSLELILILGGGSPSSLESPPLYVQRRCDDAASIVRRRQETNQQIKGRTDDTIPILCLSAGTAHAPQLMGADGVPIWESTASAAYLMKEHSNLIHSRNVYVETTSYDTIGNAYFTRTSHTDINGWRNILIITSEFHMARTKAIFDWIFGIDQKGYQLHYLSSPNVGLSSNAIEARKEKEAKSLKSVNRFAATYRSLKDVWRFLNEDHDLYTAHKLVKRGHTKSAVVSDIVKKSYGIGSRRLQSNPLTTWFSRIYSKTSSERSS